ncbi:MAG: homocysteine S-methyltransferase, partial [Saprospiraceae bacterium]|nr:homocysteine S-methyltransferase [Saprospiraceae bacterium]
KIGLTRDQIKNLLLNSVTIAQEAVQEFTLASHSANIKPLVAASLGPYGAYLADGSEYTGLYNCSPAELREFHVRRWETMADSDIDLIAFETIPNIYEAEIIRRLAEEFPDKPFWISFCCRDDHQISDGNALCKVVSFFADWESTASVGINCTNPALISSLIQEIKKGAPIKEIMVYPNSGETYDKKDRCWIGEKNATDFSMLASEWHRSGVKLLGGCCRTRPEHIAAIREILL